MTGHGFYPSSGPNTEDKAFFLSYPEVFGSASYTYYQGSVAQEGNQYNYYRTAGNRKKYYNNNGVASSIATSYWLRSPGANSSCSWVKVDYNGEAGITFDKGNDKLNIAPAFCL